MPSEQFKKFIEQNPMGIPGRKNTSDEDTAEFKVPVMPEGFVVPVPEVPAGYSCDEVVINGVKGLRVSAAAVQQGRAYMHIHGGGYTLGAAAHSVPFLVHIVEALQIECYSVEYGLAPKYQFPVQLNECLNFYQGLLDKGFSKIAVGGDSAGGNLSIAMTHYAGDKNIPLPVAVVALSPVGDFSYTQKDLYKKDHFADVRQVVKDAYAPGVDIKDPYLSPINGDFSGFPPLLLEAGGAESMAADCVHLAEKAAQADVDVMLHIWKDMGHTFPLQFGSYPEADSAALEITNFIKDKMNF